MSEKPRFGAVLDIPPENLPVRRRARNEIVDPEMPAAAPLPSELRDRFAEFDVDVSDLDGTDRASLLGFIERPFRSAREFISTAKNFVARLLEAKKEDDRESAEEEEPIPPVAEAAAKKPAAKSKPFDPEKKLAGLRRASKQILADIRDLPEPKRGREKTRRFAELRLKMRDFADEVVERRSQMARLMEAVRAEILQGIEIENGLTLEQAYTTLDAAHDPAIAPRTRQVAELAVLGSIKKLAAEWDLKPEDIDLEDLLEFRKSEVDGRALSQTLDDHAAKARLTDEQRALFRDGLKRIVARREAIADVRAEALTEKQLFKFCFGREPKGIVTVVEGPVTLYFRCHDIEDYALIVSQTYVDGGTEPVTEQVIAEARRSGGVSVFGTRVEALRENPDADLLLPDGSVDEEALDARANLLNELAGAFIAENNSVPADFMKRWDVYRHEEQHAIKKIIGEPSLRRLEAVAFHEREQMQSREYAIKDELEREFRRAATKLNEQSPDDGAEETKNRLYDMLEEEQAARIAEIKAAAEKKFAVLAARYVTELINASAKDEILAYYTDGSLENAALKESFTADGVFLPPYLLRRGEDGGLYDYHRQKNVAALAEYAMDRLDLDSGPEKTGGVFRKNIDEAVKDHRKSYRKLLRRSARAIQLLEKNGFEKQQIIDILSFEPLATWPRMAVRLMEARKENS